MVSIVPYKLVVLIASAILAATFALVAGFSLQESSRNLTEQLDNDAARLRKVYEVSQAELEHQALALAYSIATNAEIVALFNEAALAVASEGGGSGGAQSAAARRQLEARLGAQWLGTHRLYDLQQMQFLLAPGLTSFLRVHAPAEFGDSLVGVRPLLRDIERDQLPRGGFELGRAYAGIRGAVPVMYQVPGRTAVHIGTLEVGLGMEAQLERLSAKLGVGIAVLLRPESVGKAMWESYRPGASPAGGKCCDVLSTSDALAVQWIEADFLAPPVAELESVLLDWEYRTYHVVRFDLRDYLGTRDRSRPAVGSILIWRDVAEQLAAHEALRKQLVWRTLAAYVLVQLIMLTLLKLSRREWKRQLDLQTASIERLSHRNELLLQTAGEGIYGVDSEGRATFINPAALRMLGLSEDQVVGHNQHALFHHHHEDGTPYASASCPVYQTVADGRSRECEDWFWHSEGKGFPVAMTVAPIYEHGRREGAVVVFRDISELKARQDELLRLATTDPLTATNNRRRFLELLEAELARVKRHGGTGALLMTDLDHFKRINDAHGHAAGDEVLRHYARLIRETLRRTDAVGRLGGEEFAILLPEENLEGAWDLAERIRTRLEATPADVGGQAVPVTVSIGISALHPEDETAEAPLQRADLALYAAKDGGRNQVRIEDEGNRPATAGAEGGPPTAPAQTR